MATSLGRFIRLRRIELGLTQEQLAQRIDEGVAQAEISRLERDQVALPRRHRMEQLARALEVPLGVLLARSGWTGADEIQASATGTDSSARELQASNDALQASNDALRISLNHMLGKGDDPYQPSTTAEAGSTAERVSTQHLKTALDAVDDAAAVVDQAGEIILKNAAYSKMFAGEPVIMDVNGQHFPEAGTPLQRAARRERFSMTFCLDRFGSRSWFWVEGKPMMTNEGDALGVVTIRELISPNEV